MTDTAEVFTILHVPMASCWGKYSPSLRLMLLADDLPASKRRQVAHRLLTGQCASEMAAE